jgi:peptidoglycan/LPS O-acetylase OafA/YrhL
MPLFMTLSGYLAFHSYQLRQVGSNQTYKDFIINKLKKFLPPYLFFPALAIVADFLIRHVTNQQVFESVFSWFLMPKSGSAGFVWYLYVLFIFYCTLPLIYNLKKEILFLVFFGSFFLTNVPSTPLFSTDLVFRYFFFFLGGGIISINYKEFRAHISTTGWMYTLIFVIVCILDFLTELCLPFQLLSILFIPTVLFLTGIPVKKPGFSILAFLGENTFVIYLFSSLIMNVIYLGIGYYNPAWLGPLCMVIIFLSGLFLPIPVKFVFNKIVPPSLYKL